MTVGITLSAIPYFVFENAFVRREYYKDSRGGIHIKTLWKAIPPSHSTEWDFDE
jgi:hypothetical protein